MLCRLHRRADALDEACLRAQGHPHDHGIQQELLSALEWDESLHSDRVRADFRSLLQQVQGYSADLSKRIRSGASAQLVADGIQKLRRGLAALKLVPRD
jgi:hypothetical protein